MTGNDASLDLDLDHDHHHVHGHDHVHDHDPGPGYGPRDAVARPQLCGRHSQRTARGEPLAPS
ncbi:hypothetical protein ACFWJW_05000 [Streptomyces sp. NPDC127097]|uniref:hypothetical protein n=1 Tax=Streptomyces sp. NPDC127097 TaxID=3347136 RepID=UPI00364EFC76